MKQNGISSNFLNIITDFLSLRKQGVVLNGQHSILVHTEAGVAQGSILGPLFFLIYINDLSDDLTSNAKLFADITSLFPIVQNINSTTTDLNSDVSKISDWDFQWTINFNSDPNKEAQEVTFSIMTKILLFDDSSFSDYTNTLILNSVTDYVIATKRFDDLNVTLS